MRVKKGLFLLLLFFVIPFSNVYADDFSVSLSCSSPVSPSENVSCTVSVASSIPITDLTANYELDSNAGTFNFNDTNSVTDGIIGTINITAPSVSNTYTINLTSISANNNTLHASNVSTSIRVKSTENNLTSLSLSIGSISFDPNITEYNLTVDSDSINITATADQYATISGVGEIQLKYGLNNIEIKVTSETGSVKNYILKITRIDNRSSNNYLSSLIVTNTDIDFKKNIVTYNLNTTSSEVTISATKEENSSNVSGDIGKKQLNYGSNKFSVVVTAENGSKKTYTINITRIDSRSDNNYLKSLTLSKGTLNFNKTTTTYNIDVENSVDKITVSASLDDSKAKFVNGYGPREINLNEGNNIIYIKVINEKGEQRTYTLNVNRDDGRSSDSSLKLIELSNGKIDFDKDKLEYNVNVEYEVKTITVKAVASSDKAKVTIEGDGKLQLGVNDIKITVEAENGKKSVYTIKVTRKEEGYELSSNNYITSMTIKGYAIDFSSDVYNYIVKTKDYKLNISVALEDKNATYEIIGNNNLKNGSKIIIKVTAENSDVRKYIINIERPNNTIVILIIILVTLITIGMITIVLLNRKKKNNLFNQNNAHEEENIEIIEDDFSEV